MPFLANANLPGPRDDMFSKILVANRGEIACRVIKTARRLGIKTVAVYSEADRDALHVALADEAFLVGGAPARESYLAAAAIIDAALRSRAEAIHPGYGFLAENANFAESCEKAGITFIGPSASAIRAMGGKSEAKALMDKAGVPVVPGYHGSDQDALHLAREAERIGYPVLIKASAGGGGKGMKVAANAGQFSDQLASAKREAAAAFGDDRMLIEKYLSDPRHVEIQIFADTRETCVYLFDRDCSIQRRHQKIVEEAPAPDLPEDLRRRMGEAAVAAARTIGYVGAGTIEFLYSPTEAAFYFMEMNTRLQVEHPVTELITGLDLVEWQLRVAAGEPLSLTQAQLTLNGHAIEARLYAEDPERDFLPQTGRLMRLDFPETGPHVRVDTGVCAGEAISIHYDPMIAKLIVWGEDRDAAVRRLRYALGATRIMGLATNLRFLKAIAAHPAFLQAKVETGFVEQHRADLLASMAPASNRTLAMAAIGLICERAALAQQRAKTASDPFSPWNRQDGWQLNSARQDTLHLREITNGTGPVLDLTIAYLREGWRLTLPDGTNLDARGELGADGRLSVELSGEHGFGIFVHHNGEIIVFPGSDDAHRFALIDPIAEAAHHEILQGGLTSPMPGRITAFLVKEGTPVVANQPLLVLEAMKMEHMLRAPAAGVVKAFKYACGEQVPEGVELVDFEAEQE
ncbi:MAG TPA: acetyl/propionyl/methylcrotonyl-CoA carboxylase subunit alpha [Beijerinckia sp.]|nr:acetyl/propionyl/methylcrotonyl-CoA carboxylase subunit alpha [Beijerinckia sp.]